MKKEKQNIHSTRRKFLKQNTLLTGSFFIFRFASDLNKLLPIHADHQEILRAVVLGDSAMWGQGLGENDKYALKAIKAIGRLQGRETRITNLAHSGAVIQSSKEQRKKFANTYPARFAWTDFRPGKSTPLAENFVNKQDEGPAVTLFQEIPSSFPTISYQVSRVPNSIASNAELVLINGGANDLSFDEFLNPENHRDDFVKHYDPQLRDITYSRVKTLLQQARQKFPKALILYTGYFSPFSPNTSDNAIENLFTYLSGESDWLISVNSVINIKNIGQLVLEAQHRSQFGLTRGLYWTRKAITELNKSEPSSKGPRILFIHPKFAPQNTVFAADSYFHKNYKISDIEDSAETLRLQNIPRIDKEQEMKNLSNAFKAGPGSKALGVKLLRNLDGPKDLVNALQLYIGSPANVNYIKRLRTILDEELSRINRAKMASFLHPNEKGAQRYAEEIVTRFTERLSEVKIRKDIEKFENISGSNEAEQINRILGRYGLGAHNTSVVNAAQLMIIDSIALEVATSQGSERRMFDNIFLNLGNKNRWQLNFPYQHIPTPDILLKRLHRQFEPGSSDFFTIDAMGIHLSSITQFTIEREKVSSSSFSGSGDWNPTKIKLSLNGIEVFNVPFFGKLSRDGKITLPYPQK